MNWRAYVLAELRAARARARLYVFEIEQIGVMLKNDMISPEEAIEEIAAAHLLCFLHPEAEPWPADQMISSNEAAGAALAAAG